jgi:hypothetical protein
MKNLLFAVALLLCAVGVGAQTVQIPYSGSVSVQSKITGLPTGCIVGTPTFANGVIITPVTNCGSTPPPPTNCASASTAVCPIGMQVQVVSTPGTLRPPPLAGGAPGTPPITTVNGGTIGIIMSNPVPQNAAGKGWQVISLNPTIPCNGTTGPWGPTCAYIGNDNLAPSSGPPPTAPVVTCAPSSVQTGGTSNCSGNQAITSWKASAGSITSSGVFTAPSTAQSVTITGTNANGSGTTPVSVTSTSACAKTLSPSGGVDNSQILAAIAAAGGKCVELTAGTYNLTPITPPANTSLVLDNGVVITDSGIFPRTTPFFTIQNNGFSIVNNGPFLATVQMPTNHANAIEQVGKGCGDACDYEYQHCFKLVDGVSNVNIFVKLFQCAGDGVDMDDTTEAISINVDSSGNIRQGVSCTGAVNGATLTGNLHDGPLTGFDCEPDSGISGDINLTVTNLKTQNNKGGGRSYGFMNLEPTTNINVVDTGGVSTNDTGSGFAFWNRNSGTNANATGTLTIKNFTITGSSNYCMGGNKSTDGYNVVASNGTISGCGTSALHLAVAGGETGTPGGVAWSGLTITGNAPPTSFASNTKQTTITASTSNGKALTYP